MDATPPTLRDMLFEFKRLTLRESDVMRARFGLGTHASTYAEIAKKMGITREHARQIEAKALRIMEQAATRDR